MNIKCEKIIDKVIDYLENKTLKSDSEIVATLINELKFLKEGNITEITEIEIRNLKGIRNYFGENDISTFEHKAYSMLNAFIKKIDTPVINKTICNHQYVYKVLHDHTAVDVCENCGQINKHGIS